MFREYLVNMTKEQSHMIKATKYFVIGAFLPFSGFFCSFLFLRGGICVFPNIFLFQLTSRTLSLFGMWISE